METMETQSIEDQLLQLIEKKC